MKILFDQGVPKPLQTFLSVHEVHRAFQLGWAKKKNGELIELAENAGFDVLMTTDQNLRYQQNLRGRKISIFIIGRGNWPEVEPYAKQITAKVGSLNRGTVYLFEIPPP